MCNHAQWRLETMSRSYRKTPIVGTTKCHSERKDKKLWHKILRSRERVALDGVTTDTLSAYVPLRENQITSTWDMGKDGHQYWHVKRQRELAESIANRKGKNPQERAALEKRLLRKWMGK